MKLISDEDTFLNMKITLNCKGRILDLSTPAIMAVINITPDSFYNEGSIPDVNEALLVAEKMLNEGADILDIGGQSTRPGAKRISSEAEWLRIGNAIEIIHKKFPDTIISVDTFYSDVAKKAISAGASIVNDISGGELDSDMHSFISESNVPYVLMHMQGNPENMQDNPTYDNVVADVLKFFIKKVNELRLKGVSDIIIDPGFGFGKTLVDNYTLLKNLSVFHMLDCPILAGLSRKSMVTRSLNIKSEGALNGTTVLNTIALLNGASLLRVHDVREAVEVRKIIEQYHR